MTTTHVTLYEQPTPKNTATTCPVCGERGQRVATATLKALLAVSLREVRENAVYRFCPQADCEVVYFRADGEQVFRLPDVRVRVYQKEPHADDVLICYCFQHTAGAVRGSSGQAIVDDINAGIAAGQCACDWRNPQGNCCLGNVRALLKSLETET